MDDLLYQAKRGTRAIERALDEGALSGLQLTLLEFALGSLLRRVRRLRSRA